MNYLNMPFISFVDNFYIIIVDRSDELREERGVNTMY